MSDNVECEILTDDSIATTRASQTQDCAPVAQTGGVIQEVSDRQGRTVVGQLRNIFPDWIVDAELSVLLQQHECCGCELLRD